MAIGARDGTANATRTDQYAQRHDPFVYFHALLDSGSCARNVVTLMQLASDLASADRTPNVSFITPNLCHDGHDQPCANGEPGGLVSADAFLRQWVPSILASPAYQADGLLVVTFDEASTSDASACCGEASGPNTLMAGITGPGGGRVGAVLLSPFIAPGSGSDTPYNHYALLRTIEDVLGLSHLGYANGSRCVHIRLPVMAAMSRRENEWVAASGHHPTSRLMCVKRCAQIGRPMSSSARRRESSTHLYVCRADSLVARSITK